MVHSAVDLSGVAVIAAAVTLAIYLSGRLRWVATRFEVLFAHFSDAVLVTDSAGRVVRVNPAFSSLFGYEASECAGRAIDELIAGPEHRAEAQSLAARVLGGVSACVETVRLRKDGRPVEVEVVATPVVRRGRVVASYGLYRDIGPRKRAQQQLQESRERLRMMIEEAPMGVAIADLERRIIYANRALSSMLGYSVAELVGADLFTLVHVSERQRAKAAATSLVKGEAVPALSAEWCLVRKDASDLCVKISPALLRDPAGNPTYLMAMIQDLTDIKRAEEERRVLEEELRHAQKIEALGQLTGGIAHDLNNVLTVVMTNATLLASTPELAERAELADLMQASEYGRQMIQRLLAFARREPLHLAPVNLARHLADSAAVLRRLLPETIAVDTSVDAGLPDVLADPGALDQVLVNLATNARDAMPEGGLLRIVAHRSDPPGTVTAGADVAAAGSYVCITVSDSGCGMDLRTRQHVFEPFFTTKPEGQGSGLGLAMAHGIVRQHNGFIRVESAPRAGTRFDVWLPVAPAIRARTADVPIARGRTRPEAETVLVVEDQRLLRRAARRALERHGYRVLEAGDGEEGLNVYLAHEEQVDLVFTDLVMPRSGGDSLLKVLRARGARARVLVTSGYAPGETWTRAAEHPDAQFLAKPWSEAQLLRAVRDALGADANELSGATR